MHDIRFIRDNPDVFDRALNRRNLSDEEKARYSSKRLIALDETWRRKILELETAQARRNAASKEVGDAKKNKDDNKVRELLFEVAALKESIPELAKSERETSNDLVNALSEIPNLPLEDVPYGSEANDNVERRRFGAKREYQFKPRQHFEFGESLRQMDFESAAKLSGARFVVLKKGLARLERALGQFMLDVHTGEPHNYTEIAPPLLVRDEVMIGTGQLWKFRDDQFQTFTDEVRWRMSEDFARSAMREMVRILDTEGPDAARVAAEAPFTRANALIRRSSLAHSHRRSSADQPRPRIHRRRSAIADAADSVHAVLPRRGRRCR